MFVQCQVSKSDMLHNIKLICKEETMLMMNVLKVPLHPYCNSNGVWQKASNAGQVMEDLKDHNIKQGGELTIMKTLKIKIK